MTTRKPLVTISGVTQEIPPGDTVPVSSGGTSISSYTIGDLIYADGTTSLAKLSAVATGNVLLSGGVSTASSWGKVTSSHVNSSIGLTANPLSQFAATTSAQLSGIISDETGSGALVFADSPTLIAPTLGVASATSLACPTIVGSTSSGGNLTLTSTSHATKGSIVCGSQLLFNVSQSPVTPAAGTGYITYNSSFGLVISGNGSVYDLLFADKNGVTVIGVPTGTATLQSAGRLEFNTSQAFTSASSDARLSYNSTVGLTIRSAGSQGAVLITTQAGGTLIYALNSGLVGIGVTPTSALHLKAGTATSSTSPLKFTSGTLLTTPEVGAVEFLSDKWYGTITTGAARKTFAFLESPSFTTPTLGVAAATSLACPAFTTASGDMNITPAAGSSMNLTLSGSAWLTVSKNNNDSMLLYDRRTVAADIGGSVFFGGSYTGSTQTTWAGISGRKENATDGQYGGYLSFYTRPNGGSQTERIRVTSAGNVGIQQTSPTAALHLPASTTARASLCMPAGDGPTSKVAGDIWNDNTRKSITAYIGSMTQYDRRVVFSNTAQVDIGSTTTETSLFTTGIGTTTLAANSLAAGKLVEIVIRGFLSTNTSGTNTLQIRCKLAGTTRLDTGAITMPNSIGQSPVYEGTFEIRCYYHVLSSGASGSCRAWGTFVFHKSTGTAYSYAMNQAYNPIVTVDTTTANAIAATAQWGASSGFNVVYCTSQQISLAA